jgi:hypothetical protein
MNRRKAEIRKAVLDILSGRASSEFPQNQFGHLKEGVAKVLESRGGTPPGRLPMDFYPELSGEDETILREVFWDLFIEKVITIGCDGMNPEFPWFRLHSEAVSGIGNLK